VSHTDFGEELFLRNIKCDLGFVSVRVITDQGKKIKPTVNPKTSHTYMYAYRRKSKVLTN